MISRKPRVSRSGSLRGGWNIHYKFGPYSMVGWKPTWRQAIHRANWLSRQYYREDAR